MIKLLTLVVGLILVSCNPPAPVKEKPRTVPTSEGELRNDNINSTLDYDEYSLEGCQYIAVGWGNSRWGSHKGNCTNPIHNK